MAKATFGAGCFWGIEELYRTTEGVTATSVGYMGGTTDNPTYQEVCTGTTGHAEVVQVEFDNDVISFEALVDIFFDNHNPTELNRQGPDTGTQYRSVVFYEDENQKDVSVSKIADFTATGRFKRPIVTKLVPVEAYWPAEEYHQNYLLKRGMASCHI